MKTKILSCLLMLGSFATMANEEAPKTAQELLDVVREDLITLTADFSQYEIDANENISEKIGGQVWLKSPNKFKWEYAEPAPQLIVANGEKVWIFDADLEQVTIKKQENTQNPIYVLLNKKDTEENFNLKLLPKKQDNNQAEDIIDMDWIEMTPKKPGDDVKNVWLGIDGNKLQVIKLKNQLDNMVVFEFSHILRNPELEESFFTFEVPNGIDIIQDAGFSAEF